MIDQSNEAVRNALTGLSTKLIVEEVRYQLHATDKTNETLRDLLFVAYLERQRAENNLISVIIAEHEACQ